MRKNKKLSWLIAVIFIFTTMLGAVPSHAVAADLSDINGHWAQSQIQSLITKGVVTGYPDNTFKPDNTISRAEFITMTNRAFSFTATSEINYTDVPANEWYAAEVAKAKAAGYIAGYEDGTMRPGAQITRQEVAKILSVILKLDSSSDSAVNGFTDAASIPAWSRGYVAAMVTAGYINGYPDGTFKASNAINRAEASVIMGRATGPVVPPVQQKAFDKAGTYGPASGTQTIDGNVTISADGVILQNTTIKGNLLITEAVGAGAVTLKNITVTGTTTFKGGGLNSIYIDNCKLGKVIADKANGNLRIVLSGTSKIAELVANYAVKVEGTGTIDKATIHTNGVSIATSLISKNNITVDSGKSMSYGTETISGTTSGGSSGSDTTPTTPPTVTSITVNDESEFTAALGNATYNTIVLAANIPGEQTINRSVTINGQGHEFSGNKLTLDPGATGEVTLQNVTVNGLDVLSGAANSITLVSVTVRIKMIVTSTNVGTTTRIVASGTTSITATDTNSNVNLEQAAGSTGSFGSVNVNSASMVGLAGTFSQNQTVNVAVAGATITTAANSTVSNVEVNAANVNLNTTGTVSNVSINNAASTVSLTGAGTCSTVTVESSAVGANITTSAGATVSNVVANANVNLNSAGTISNVNVQTASEVNVQSGTVAAVTVAPSAAGANVTTSAGATVSTIVANANVNLNSAGTVSNVNVQTASAVNVQSGTVAAVTVASSAAGANVTTSAGATVSTIVANANVNLNSAGTVSNVNVQTASIVNVQSGTVAAVTVAPSAAGANVTTSAGATVSTVVANANVNLNSAGTVSNVNVQTASAVNVQSGTVNAVTVASSAGGANVTTSAGATVSTVVANANVNLNSAGTVSNVNVQTASAVNVQSGTVNAITVAPSADGASISTATGTTVSSVTVSSSTANFENGGTITTIDATVTTIIAIGGNTAGSVTGDATVSVKPLRPVPSKEAGAVPNGTSILLSTIPNDAAIYYTIDGTTPDATKTLYAAGIPISSDAVTTIKAVAIKEGVSSEIFTGQYTKASSACDITAFSIPGKGTGTVSGTDITVTVPYGTILTNLIATFTSSPYSTVKIGANNQTSGQNSNNFSSAVTYIVTAQDGTTTKNYTVTVTPEAASTNADLSGLVVSGVSLNPAFASGTLGYAVSVANSVTSLTVTPTVSESHATVKVNGVTVVSGGRSGAISLNVGSNPIPVEVKAQDGTTIKTYTITVNRAASIDANLSGLIISQGTLTPIFAAGTNSYTASVGNAVTSMTVTPTVKESHATVKVNTVAVTSGSESGAIALSVGANTITVEVKAQDGTTVKTYTVTVTRAANNDATLSTLTLSGVTLTPSFASGTLTYTASVANSVDTTTVAATATNAGATVTAGDLGAKTLAVGENIITVHVTAENGTSTETYTVTVTRAASSDASLSTLTLSGVTLTPSFASGTLTYTASVANSVDTTTVAATATNAGAIVTAGDLGAKTLAVGENIITVHVTAADATAAAYTVTVTRAASSDASLSTLTLSGVTLTPSFASGTLTYTASVANSVNTTTVTATATNAGATVTAGDLGTKTLAVGENIITVHVTAADATVATYTVTVTRAASSDASLSTLTLSGVTLTPSFASGTLTYTASVANSVDTTTVAATATNAGATVTAGDLGAKTLAVGENIITVHVTAADATAATYTVTVTRAAAASTDATLSALSISQGTLDPVFGAATTAYTASVANTVTSMTVTPTVTESHATVKVNDVAVDSGNASGAIALDVGVNTITVEVIAQDGTSKKSYTITVTRAAAPLSTDATLSALTISEGTLDPAFAAGTTSYTASVVNTVASMTVTPTVTESHATVKVNDVAVDSGNASGAIALDVGVNTITVEVIAQDGTSKKSYTITVTRAAAAGDAGTLMIASGSVSQNKTITVSVTSGLSGANYYKIYLEVEGEESPISDTIGSLGSSIVVADSLIFVDYLKVKLYSDAAATNMVAIAYVTASNFDASTKIGSSPLTNITTVPVASADATLSALTISEGTLDPAFAAGTTSYTASVVNTVASMTVTPTVTESHATVKVNDVAVDSGNASGAIALDVGVNTITVEVIAQDGTSKKSYTITVTRAAAAGDAGTLMIASGSVSQNKTITVSVTSGLSGANYYKIYLEVEGEESPISDTIGSLGSSIVVADSLIFVDYLKVKLYSDAAATNMVAIAYVTASNFDASTKIGSSPLTNITTVPVASADATLSALTISEGTLDPAFAAGTTSYTASVVNTVASMTVTPTVTESHATVKVNDVAVDSGNASGAIALDVGVNTITVEVIAQDGTSKKSYTITVTRAAAAGDAGTLMIASGSVSQNKTITVSVTSGLSGANYYKIYLEVEGEESPISDTIGSLGSSIVVADSLIFVDYLKVKLYSDAAATNMVAIAYVTASNFDASTKIGSSPLMGITKY